MTTPTTSYKVAVTNEDWSPLIGVEIEAMNLTTLLPDDVQRTGLDGVAIFTGLTGGPHFFKVRDRRVSTAISADLSVENQGRVRSYIGAIHVQVIAMGNQGITKHYIVDASGLGTHTTVQAAITAAIALSTGFEVVIYINPGAYTEDLTVPFASTGGSIYFVAEGAVVNFNAGAYNSIVTITGSSGSSPVLEASGVGNIATVGIEFAQKTGGSAETIKLAVNNDLEMYECKLVACAGQRVFTAVIDVRCRNCVITAASGRIIDPANAVYFEHCYINGAGLIKGNWDTLVLKDCILIGTAPAGEYWIHEAALVVSTGLYVIGCRSSAGGGSGFISYGDPSAVSNDCIITNNKINVGSGQIGIRLIELVAAVVTDNLIEGTSNSDGSTAISLAGAVGGACRACVVAHNSIHKIQTGINRGTDATDGTCVIGPNAFYDVGTNTTGVPPGEDYGVTVADLDHVLLDGDLHTDTVAQTVTAGSLIFGNDTPAWDELAISVPAANVRNVLGVDNGETVPSWKTALDGTNPAAVAATASAGTSLVFAHRDHVHAHPNLGDLHTGYLLADGSRALSADWAAGAGYLITAKGLFDADKDTGIYVEKTSDEDIVRIDAAGTEIMTIGHDGAVDILHTAAAAGEHGLEMIVDAAGKGNVHAVDVVLTTGAIAAGAAEEAILVNIDESAATGGSVAGLRVLSTEGMANVHALEVGVVVGPIHQLSGTFEAMDVALVKATDRLTEFLSTGSDIAFFVADNDTVTIGDAAQFFEIEFLLATVSSKDVKPTFEYSKAGGLWEPFFPADGTNGMQNSGVIAWEPADVASPAWVVHSGNYRIRITRTKGGSITSPIEDKVQIAAAIEFGWDKSGDVIINSLSTDTISERTPATGVTIEGTKLIDYYLELAEITKPSNPDDGYGRLYMKNTDKVYFLATDGTEYDLTAAVVSPGHAILDGSVHTDSVADAVTAGSIIIGNDTPKWDELVIAVPAANVRNVLGIDNGETTPTWKTALDGTNPAAAGPAASPGTSLVFAHRDHVHALGTLGATWVPGAQDIGNYDFTAKTLQTQVGDSSYVLWLDGDDPTISFAAGDYIQFDRSENELEFFIGTSLLARLSASGFFVDTITELTGAAGVTVESVLLKDGQITLGTDVVLSRGAAGRLLVTGTGDDIVSVGDANFTLNFAGGSPLIVLDVNDYWQYVRSTNTLNFAIGGAVQFSFASGIASYPRGAVILGTDDTLRGLLTLYGHTTGAADGGEVRFHLSADHDGTFEYWLIKAEEDDLTFASSNGAAVNKMTPAGQLQLLITGSGAGILIGGDANLYRSAADVLKTDDALQVSTVAAIGGNASIDSAGRQALRVEHDTGDCTALLTGAGIVIQTTADSTTAGFAYGLRGGITHTGTNASFIAGLFFDAIQNGAGNLQWLHGVYITLVSYADKGTIAASHGLEVVLDYQGNKPTTFRGLYINGHVDMNTAYGVHVEDFVGTTIRLLEIGPATPYLRLVGGANPAANQTNLYLKEEATLRQVQWKAGDTLGAADKVMVLV